MTIKVGWAEGECPRCGRILRRQRPADLAFCDCYSKCSICGAEMTPVTPDLNPKTYRAEEVDDPSGAAEKSECTMFTRYYCSACDNYEDGVPVEVHLS